MVDFAPVTKAVAYPGLPPLVPEACHASGSEYDMENAPL